MNYYFYISNAIYMIWLLSEVFLNRLKRSAESDKKGADKNSLTVIWLTIAVSMTAGVMLTHRTHFPIANPVVIKITGISLVVLGIIIRFFAVRSLGKMFTVDVTIREGHALNTSGMYAFLRHPSYSGSLISFMGFGLAQDNWLGFALIVIPVFISFVYRANIEEKVLIEAFGNDYIEYKKRSKRFFPFIY